MYPAAPALTAASTIFSVLHAVMNTIGTSIQSVIVRATVMPSYPSLRKTSIRMRSGVTVRARSKASSPLTAYPGTSYPLARSARLRSSATITSSSTSMTLATSMSALALAREGHRELSADRGSCHGKGSVQLFDSQHLHQLQTQPVRFLLIPGPRAPQSVVVHDDGRNPVACVGANLDAWLLRALEGIPERIRDQLVDD